MIPPTFPDNPMDDPVLTVSGKTYEQVIAEMRRAERQFWIGLAVFVVGLGAGIPLALWLGGMAR